MLNLGGTALHIRGKMTPSLSEEQFGSIISDWVERFTASGVEHVAKSSNENEDVVAFSGPFSR